MRETAGGILCVQNHVCLVWKTGGKREGWVIPKGGVDAGESLEQTAVREVLEETGLAVSVARCLGVVLRDSIHPGYEGDKKRITVFLLRHQGLADRALPSPKDAETAGWVPLSEIDAAMRYDEEREFIKEHMRDIVESSHDIELPRLNQWQTQVPSLASGSLFNLAVFGE